MVRRLIRWLPYVFVFAAGVEIGFAFKAAAFLPFVCSIYWAALVVLFRRYDLTRAGDAVDKMRQEHAEFMKRFATEGITVNVVARPQDPRDARN